MVRIKMLKIQLDEEHPISSTDPSSGKVTYSSTVEEFFLNFIKGDKISDESYIHPHYVDLDCGGCNVFKLVNNSDLNLVTGYLIVGVGYEYDRFCEPHKVIEQRKVTLQIGGGLLVNRLLSKTKLSRVILTNELDVFFKICFTKSYVIYLPDLIFGLQEVESLLPESVLIMTANYDEDPQPHIKFSRENLSRLSYADVQERIDSIHASYIDSLKHEDGESESKVQSSNSWPALASLSSVNHNSPQNYPLWAFPALIANAIKKTAYIHKVPISVAGQTYLGEMAFLSQRHINAPSDKMIKGQPCSLFTITIFPSGAGKDNCINDACYVSKTIEKSSMSLYEKEYNEWVRSKGELIEPKIPLARFKKLTIQGLISLVKKSDQKSFTWTTGEGAYLFSGYTMKSDTVGEALSVINNLLDGESISNVLKGSNIEYVDGVRFSINIGVQDVIAYPALQNELLREQGFLARALIVFAEPLQSVQITKQDRSIRPDQDIDLKAYWSLCEKILSDVPKALDCANAYIVILKTEEADDLHIEYENFILREVEKNGRYAFIHSYARRTVQYVLRVAAIFAFFKQESVITSETMKGAITICRYSLEQWIDYYGKDSKSDSEILLEWLKAQYRKGNKRVLKSSINQKHAKFKSAKLRDAALQYLIETYHIRIDTLNNSDYVVLHPELVENLSN